MQLMKLSTLCSLIFIGISCGVSAHADYDKPRYVDPMGVDHGKCDTIDNPCASISYASQQANKGDVVLLSQGSYDVSLHQDIFYLVSGLVPVQPGYSRLDGYQTQNIHINETWLTKVPLQFAQQLRTSGFRVSTDRKGVSEAQQSQLNKALQQFDMLQQPQTELNCSNGNAGQFSCENVDLLAHVPLSQLNNASGANDIWGFVDLNDFKEYALIGLRNGISVVDVSVPQLPQVVGSISAQTTTWRDIKVLQRYNTQQQRFNAYAYVTADNANVGLMIIDLTNLPSAVSLLAVDQTDSAAHNVYLANVDYSTGVVYADQQPQLHVAGASAAGGAYKSFAVNANGELTVEYAPNNTSRSDYTHDLSSAIIVDERVGSQCQGVNGQCTVTYDYNEDVARIWDTSINHSPVEIGRIGASLLQDVGYIHSGWSSEDNRVLFVHDELDEMNFNKNTTLQAFDISNLNDPQPLSVWTGSTPAIDHNGYVRGNRYYMSNYTRGLTILDISQPANITEVGHFDTYPLNDGNSFNGAWGVYPFLPSGILLVSDINSGLYILKDNTRGQGDDAIVQLAQSYYTVREGDDVLLAVKRFGDLSESISVRFETQVGSADQQDFTMQRGQLTWAANDNSDKLIQINTVLDEQDDETNELFSIRLYAPSEAVNLAPPMRTVINIDGLVNPASAYFSDIDLQAQESQGEINIPVYREGDINQSLTVNYNAAGSTAIQGVDFQLQGESLSWSIGDNSIKNINIVLIDDTQQESDKTIRLNLTQQQPSKQAQISVLLRDDDANQPPQVQTGEDLIVNGGESFSLIAIASDPEGGPLTYQWQQVAGTSVLLNNSGASIASAMAPNVAETLRFTVNVTDDFGIMASDEIQVSVRLPSSQGTSGGVIGYGWLILLSLCMIGRSVK